MHRDVLGMDLKVGVVRAEEVEMGALDVTEVSFDHATTRSGADRHGK